MIHDYVVPHVAKLIEIGASRRRNKASEFERMVADIFRLLDFEVEYLGQGTGRNPDAIAKYREEHTAFIIDAKAYNEGYTMGVDDRAIAEYINHYCPKLRKEGLTRIGFIIVSNSFKSKHEHFVNEITWSSDVKRFNFLTSDALLHLLGYKTKNNLPVGSVIQFLTGNGPVITAGDVTAKLAG